MNDNDYKTTLPKMGLKTRSYNMDMNKKDLKRLSKSQLIKLLLKQEAKKPIPQISVNEDIILQPPKQFRDRPPKPTRKPPPLPQVEEKEHIRDCSLCIGSTGPVFCGKDP